MIATLEHPLDTIHEYETTGNNIIKLLEKIRPSLLTIKALKMKLSWKLQQLIQILTDTHSCKQYTINKKSQNNTIKQHPISHNKNG